MRYVKKCKVDKHKYISQSFNTYTICICPIPHFPGEEHPSLFANGGDDDGSKKKTTRSRRSHSIKNAQRQNNAVRRAWNCEMGREKKWSN